MCLIMVGYVFWCLYVSNVLSFVKGVMGFNLVIYCLLVFYFYYGCCYLVIHLGYCVFNSYCSLCVVSLCVFIVLFLVCCYI